MKQCDIDSYVDRILAIIPVTAESRSAVRKNVGSIVASAVSHAEDDVKEDAYDEGFDAGKEESPDHPFPDVDDATLDDVLTGIRLLRAGDPQWRVYIDGALQDFNSNLISCDLDQPRLI